MVTGGASHRHSAKFSESESLLLSTVVSRTKYNNNILKDITISKQFFRERGSKDALVIIVEPEPLELQ